MPQRTLGALALLLVAALTSGCDVVRTGYIGSFATVGAPAAEPPFEPTDADYAAIRRLLADRAAAIRQGDQRAYVATLDPGNAKLRAQQLQGFQNLQDLPLVRIGYKLFEFTNDDAVDVRGDDPAIRPDVVELVRLETVDSLAVGNNVNMTFVRRGGKWLLAAERKAERKHFDGPGGRPWYGVRLDVVERDRLIVVADRGSGAGPGLLAVRAEAELQSISALLGVASDRAVLIDATSTGDPTTLNAEGAEAAAVSYAVQTADGQRVAGWRIKINPQRIDELVDNRWLLRHELTHFVTTELIQSAPTWVREGLAEYVAVLPYSFANLRFEDRFAQRLRTARLEVPSSPRFGEDPRMDYTVSHAAVNVLVNLRGIDGLKQLVRAYARLQTGANFDPRPDWATPEVLRKVYGFGLPELRQRTRALVLQTL